MRRYLYLSTAVAGAVMTAGAGTSFAQCVTTQNCAELGYTETSCPDGTGIKCPFGNTFACTGGSSEITPEQCTQLGFTHACTGTNESGSGKSCGGKYISCTCKAPYTWSNGACSCPATYKYTCKGVGEKGSGKVCDGKYTTCTCDKGYEWKNGKCQALNGAKGDLYYCNGKVVGVKDSGMSFYVALQDIAPYHEGRVEKVGWIQGRYACEEYTFCGNLNGKLPSLDQLQTIYNHRGGLDYLLSTNGGSELIGDYYWSSSEYAGYRDHYCLSMADGDEKRGGTTNWNNYARPILDSY